MSVWSLSRYILLIFLLFVSVPDVRGAGRMAPDFDLENWDGRRLSLERLSGKVVVLTFSYAYCSVRCPIITGRLYSLDAEMNAPRDVVYLHVSVDPDMDTPERRKKYFGLYGIDVEKDGRWLFVSGGRDELERLWDFYSVAIEKVEERNIPEGYYMEYTPRVVVINKRGMIEHETGFFFTEDELSKKIRELL